MTGILKYLEKQSPVRRYDAMLARNDKRIAFLEEEHRKCMDQHAIMAQELGELRGRLREIEKKL